MEEYIGHLYQNYGQPPVKYSLLELLDGFAWFQEQWYQELYKDPLYLINNIDEYFEGDWRKGKEMHKVVITQRFYQTSTNQTKA